VRRGVAAYQRTVRRGTSMKSRMLQFLLMTVVGCSAALLLTMYCAGENEEQETVKSGTPRIQLPEPRRDGDTSVEAALLARRSARSYSKESLTLAEVSQLLWAAQGITNDRGFRTAPSAGALYPLEVYLVAGKVENLPAGIYRYEPQTNQLKHVRQGDHRAEASEAALRQQTVRQAAINIVFSGVVERTAQKYGTRAQRYVLIETGHAAQNVLLQAVALGLAAVPVGAFDDDSIAKTLSLKPGEEPLYILPVGRP
jgi:SagB-type dehydrogenase family enzyme